MLKRISIGLAVLSTAMAGGLGTAATVSADDQAFISQIHLTAHPSVKIERLLELGHIACAARRSGESSDQAKMTVWESLDAQGVMSSMAEMGSLVHVAVNTLCPEVGYP